MSWWHARCVRLCASTSFAHVTIYSLNLLASPDPTLDLFGGTAHDMTHLKSLEPVTLGGTAQWLFIHGDTHNPLLLWLHGGPGSADIATAAFYGRALTEHFLVVHGISGGRGSRA